MKNKQLFYAFAMGILGAASFKIIEHMTLSTAMATSPNQVLTATTINLVDSKGKIRMQIGFAKEAESPAIWLFDKKGVARLNLGLYEDETAFVGLQDKSGQMVQLLRSFGANEAPLHIYKNKGADKMIMGLNPGASLSPFVMYYDKSNQRTLQFGQYEGP